jgi:Tfp pilus assembly protein PilX
MHRSKPREKGAALFLSLLVGVVLLGMALPFLFKMTGRYHITEKSYKSLAALNLAEAGVERAIWELNYGNISSWSGSSASRTLTIPNFTASDGDVIGDIAITVSDPAGNNPVIESTGSVPFVASANLSRTVCVVLQAGGAPPTFDFGVFGDKGATVDNNAYIDSYDSRLGAYGGSNIHHNGDVGTNATTYASLNVGLTFDNNAYIDGDAMTGYQSNPNSVIHQGNNSVITGQKAALSAPKAMPSVPEPTGLTYQGDYSLGDNGTGSLSQSSQYTNFTLSNNAVVTIVSNVTLYITGTFTLSNNAQFRINSGCGVTMYFGGTWNISNNALINNLTQDPTKLLMFGTDSFSGSKTFCNNTATYGALYFPKADVTLSNNGGIFGSVVANKIVQSNNAAIHYDEALGSLSTGFGSSGAYVVKSWQEK